MDLYWICSCLSSLDLQLFVKCFGFVLDLQLCLSSLGLQLFVRCFGFILDLYWIYSSLRSVLDLFSSLYLQLFAKCFGFVLDSQLFEFIGFTVICKVFWICIGFTVI